MATSYKLTTLNDVYEQVPADKIALCMSEIARGMEYAKQLEALVGGTKLALQMPCEWIDDGMTNQTMNVTDMSGQDIFTFEAKSAP